jgi:hypothetical protein
LAESGRTALSAGQLIGCAGLAGKKRGFAREKIA